MGSSFSRAQAANAKNNASTAILRSALTNYINATKNMNANKIRAALNNKRIGLTESYKNSIANGVANAVIKARKANVAVAAANLGAASETVAAAHVNNAAKQINNLKNKLEGSSGAASVPQPKGLGGALFGVKKGNNQNNSTNNVNRNYVLAILKNNAKYQNNKSKINAIVAYNPGLNFSKLARNNNNAKIKNLLAQANSIKKFKQGPAQHTGYNLGNNNQTGNMFKQANNAAIKAKNNALQQGKTEQTANANAARAAAQTAVANAPPNANANAVRQAAKAATLAAGATPAAANNASKMVTKNLEEQKN